MTVASMAADATVGFAGITLGLRAWQLLRLPAGVPLLPLVAGLLAIVALMIRAGQGGVLAALHA